MRTNLLLGVSAILLLLGSCVAGKTGGEGDDDDSTTTTTTTTTTGSGTTTNTGTPTTSTTNTGTPTTSSTTSTQTPSCYANHGDCDPMQTNCPTAGASCDIDGGTQQFVCFDPPNTAAEGAPCNVTSGPYCMNGLTCVNNGTSDLCAAYCCSETDCGGGTCQSLGMTGTIEVKVCTS